MTSRPMQSVRNLARGAIGAGVFAAAAAGSGVAAQVMAQPLAPSRAVAAAPEEGARWQDLKPSQRDALLPLEKDWRGIGADQKQKWLRMADGFPAMPVEERARIQTRMAEWAKLSPQERGRARLQFQEARQAAPKDRQAQWEAYQALPAEKRNQLAARVLPATSSAGTDASRATKPNGQRAERGEKAATAMGKSNLVPNPAFAAPPKPVAPMVMQAQPGATTSLISKRALPPPHQQTGLPKIAATSGFVDQSTLLPKRGPQGAATRSAAASEVESPKRR